MKFKHLVLGSSLTALGLGFTVSSLAQGIQEIIVTAQKREESAQDIPIAIDVITGDTFIKEGVRDIKDMNKMSTELEMNFNAGQATTIGIRGMQQPGFSPNADTLAAVHVDGAYISSFWSLNGLMFDLARAEVLSGPQGTLYGRNSAAGAVNLITKRPGDVFEGNVSLDVGNYDSLRMEGGVSIPLGDRLSMRVAGMSWTRDPLFTNGGADVDQAAGRLSLNWDVTDNDTVFATYDYSDFRGYVESGNTLLGIVNVPNYNIATSTLNTVQPVPASIQGLTVPSDPYDNLAYERDRRQLGYFKGDENWNRTFGIMAQWDHDFGSFGSTLQYAYRRNKDIAYSNPTYPLANFAATQALPNTFTNDIESTTVEFRLTSSGDTSLEWVAGLFYFDGKALGDNATPVNANAASRVLATGRIVPQVRALNPETNLNTIGYPFQNSFGPNSGTTESWAVFAQATWTPESLDRWHFTAGARYSADEKTALLGTWVNGTLSSLVYDPSKYASIAALPSYVAPYVVTAAEATLTNPATFVQPIGNDSWGSVQWRLGVDFDLTDTSLLYGSVATGYKSGGFSYGSTPRIEPEDLLAFEIGTKNQLLGNTLQLNASAWYYIYENLEATATRPLAGNAVVCNGTPTFDGSGNLIGCSTPIVTSTGSVANVAEAKVAGVSFDTEWLVTDADRISLSGTWTYSKIVDGHENYLGVRRLVANEGERIGDAPEFVWLARYAHTFSFSNGASLEPQLKYQWQSEKWDRSSIPAGSYIAPGTDARATAINLVATPTNPLVYNLAAMNPKETAIPSRGILDFSMRYTAPSGNWDLTGYVNNLTDELNIRTRNFGNNPLSSGATGNYGHITGTLGEPRMWGLVLNARF